MIISPKKAEIISKKKGLLEKKLKRKGLVSTLKDFFRTSLQDEANLHSCRIEYCSNGAVSKTEEQIVREQFEECLRNLNYTWEWATDNFSMDFGEDFIIEIAKKVENGYIQGYRKGDVRPTGSSYTPPRVRFSDKLKRELDTFMSNINRGRDMLREGKISPVELAILTHFHLVRIHPFDDGNGRTSRLMQNLILYHHSFPVSVIYKGEKSEYVKHLEEAALDHRFRVGNENYWEDLSEKESRVYDYLASKASISLDLVIDGRYKK